MKDNNRSTFVDLNTRINIGAGLALIVIILLLILYTLAR